MFEPQIGDLGPARVLVHSGGGQVQPGAFPSVNQGPVGSLGQQHGVLGVEAVLYRPLSDLGIEVGVQLLEGHAAVGIARLFRVGGPVQSLPEKMGERRTAQGRRSVGNLAGSRGVEDQQVGDRHALDEARQLLGKAAGEQADLPFAVQSRAVEDEQLLRAVLRLSGPVLQEQAIQEGPQGEPGLAVQRRGAGRQKTRLSLPVDQPVHAQIEHDNVLARPARPGRIQLELQLAQSLLLRLPGYGDELDRFLAIEGRQLRKVLLDPGIGRDGRAVVRCGHDQQRGPDRHVDKISDEPGDQRQNGEHASGQPQPVAPLGSLVIPVPPSRPSSLSAGRRLFCPGLFSPPAPIRSSAPVFGGHGPSPLSVGGLLRTASCSGSPHHWPVAG